MAAGRRVREPDFGLSLFLAGGFVYLVPLWLPGAAWGADSALAFIGKAVSILGMVTIIGYMGFVYTASKGVPFWNSPLHPALYIGYALRGGIAGLLLAQLADGAWLADLNSLLLLWSGITAVVALFFGLEVHGALNSGNAAARRSVHELFAGSVAIYFYGGILLLGADSRFARVGRAVRTGVRRSHDHACARLGRGRLLHEVFHHPRRCLSAGVDFVRAAALVSLRRMP